MVDFNDTPEQTAWRAEVTKFVEEHLPPDLAEDAEFAGTLGGVHRGPLGKQRVERMKEWRQAILDRGWIAPAWPKAFGGAEMTAIEQFILREVFTEMRAPIQSVHDIGSTILVHGSDEQKAKYLPPMVRGEIQWAQGYSEPGSGSDLASVQTRGEHDGDDFVINGQKIWTSGAMTADMIFALVRTDPEAPKHRGISYLLFELDKPGISIRPLDQMSGASQFTEVFFEDVRVPVSAAIGEVNRGWYVGATHLDFERSSIGSAVSFANRLNDLTQFLKNEADTGRSRLKREPAFRDQLADRATETTVARQFSNRIITMQARGIIPNIESSAQKLFSSELHQRTSNTGLNAMGQYGMLYDENDERTPQRARWGTYYLASVSETIGAGTSEIQRNVIATRGLGLPRG